MDENISFYRHMFDESEGQYEVKAKKLPTVNVTIQNTISAHMKFEKDGMIVLVPDHNSKGVEKGTYYSILRQAGLK